MVVNMIKWRPWLPPLQSRKFEVKIVVGSIKGLNLIQEEKDDSENYKFRVEIKWKSPKSNGFKSLKNKGVKKFISREERLGHNGVVQWDEEFTKGSEKRTKKMAPLTASAVLNLAEFVSLEEDVKDFDINVPLSILHSGFKCSPSLCISLSLMELKSARELSVEGQRPIMFAPLSPCFGASHLIKKDEASSFKSNLRKVKSLTDFVSSRKLKKADNGEGSCDSKFSTGSEDSDPFDTDSFGDTDEGESEESKEDVDVQKSCSYGTLVHANFAGGALDLGINCEGNDLVYYGRHKPHVDSSVAQDYDTSISKQLQRPSSKFGISWTKGKLSFKSRKVKGEPLLKKDYGEEGGDDIDFYRRQLSSDESLAQFEGLMGSRSFISEFGDDNFAVGNWEQKEVLSRDGSMKLQTQVFFASIDQRSERAAGESACTALVAVIADWLHSNQREMPVKSEFDSLIREGSLQWRNLCENEDYREKFPDKHFDLETVIQAKIRPLSVVPERSFIGFFHPDGLEEECFGFLQGAMVDWDAFYIIDTLGERLYEGCSQAFVLKFNHDTTIETLPCQTSSSEDAKPTETKSAIVEASSSTDQQQVSSGLESESVQESEGMKVEEKVHCRGKDSCKEYIKSFLAAIPIRELQIDMKKGLKSSAPIHQRLQIEFNFTKQQFFPAPAEYIASEMAGVIPILTAADVHALMAVDQVTAPIMVADLPAPIAVDVPASMMTVAVA
uniref:C2 NT-type domain-containing protein n=1 Tax=Chenopodium quinoa TaxID=63459 RepID=A0A803LJY2_CHEQI